MSKKFIPDSSALMQTDWKKPTVDVKDIKSVVLLGFIAVAAVAVFLPWLSVGASLEDYGTLKLRAFGFGTWYGIVGLFAALIAIAGVLYKHYSLTFCASLAAVVMGIIGLNAHPDANLSVSFDSPAIEAEYNKGMKELGLGSSPSIEIPGPVVALVEMGVDFVDQDVFKTLLMKNPQLKNAPFDELDFINHRLGAWMYLIFSALAAVLSYIILSFGDIRCFMKKATPAPVVSAPQDEETVVG